MSRRSLGELPQVRELADAIMSPPMPDVLDEAGAVEIAKLLVLIDRVDTDPAERGITGRAPESRVPWWIIAAACPASSSGG